MTVVAVYIGGPLDGQKREEPRAFETRLHHQAAFPPVMGREAEALDYTLRTTYYTRRVFRVTGGVWPLPFELYAPSNMSDAQMMERLVEYYSPEPEETR